MVDGEKVIKGLEHCGQPTECDGCPYDSAMGGCFTNLKSDALELLKEYDGALRLMVLQYCARTDLDLGKLVFDHQFMCAGEEAFSLLGIKEGQQVTEGLETEYWLTPFSKLPKGVKCDG